MEFDYEKLGLMCGLEVHQQLDTGKLFIRTPSILRDDEPDYKIERKLRPVASELGEFDKAALEAFKKGLTYIYEGYNDTISLVELDEEPPQPCDEEALKTILEISLMTNARIFDEMFVMRKAVIDGSNTSAFQRTMLVSMGGSLKISNKEIGLQAMALEEDAARPVEKTETHIVYRLDRLGIPLIELATDPDIKTPKEAKETAKKIGELFRRTGRVKRGLGTIRQDLNISIRDGARVEIKGVQDLELIDEYVKREVERQVKLVELKKKLEERNLKPQNLEGKEKDLEKIFSNTEAKIVKSAIEKKEKVIGMKLEKFAGLIGFELQEGRRVGTEFANYVKTKTGLKGIFHSDELPKYGISEKEVEETRKALSCENEDGFVIITGKEEKVKRGLEAILERTKQCLVGVPEETRGALDGGNTEYLRPLPGAARMYPETDLASIIADEKLLKEIKKDLPLTVKEREELYKKIGLNEKYISGMKLNNFARFFERKVKEGMDAKMLASFLLDSLVEARRKGADIDKINEKMLEEFLHSISSGKIMKEIQLEVFIEWSKKPQEPLEAIITKKAGSGASKGEAEAIVKAIVEKNKILVEKMGERAVGPLMGDAMKQLKGKVSGTEISNLLKKEIQKHI